MRTHKSTEPLERPRDADMGVDLDEYALGGMDEHLQQARLVEGRVEQCQEALHPPQTRSQQTRSPHTTARAARNAPDE